MGFLDEMTAEEAAQQFDRPPPHWSRMFPTHCTRCSLELRDPAAGGLCGRCAMFPRLAPDLLQAIAPALESPISRQRWLSMQLQIQRELHHRASRHGTDAAEELFGAASAAALIAQVEGRSLPARSTAAWATHYSTRIEAGVCEDLFGPGWDRHRDREAPFVDLVTAGEVDHHHAGSRLEAESEFRQLMRSATDAERQYLEECWRLVVQEGWDPRSARVEAAASTGRNPNAARQLLFRLRKRRRNA